MKAGCLLTARRKVANVFPAGTGKSQSVTTRLLSVRAFEGIFDPGVHFTIFIGYEPCWRQQRSWTLFCHMYNLCCVGRVDSRVSQAACEVHHKRCCSVIYNVEPNIWLDSINELLHWKIQPAGLAFGLIVSLVRLLVQSEMNCVLLIKQIGDQSIA